MTISVVRCCNILGYINSVFPASQFNEKGKAVRFNLYIYVEYDEEEKYVFTFFDGLSLCTIWFKTDVGTNKLLLILFSVSCTYHCCL